MADWSSPNWQTFYNQAAQQNVIDPAVVVAIARSETGNTLVNQGLFTLGIDSNGTPGLPGSFRTGNATHQFYAYNNGLEAAQSLIAYFNTPLYNGSNILAALQNAPAMLQVMVNHGYSGCPGPECDPTWATKISSLRDEVIRELGTIGEVGSGGNNNTGSSTSSGSGGSGGSSGNSSGGSGSSSSSPLQSSELGTIFVIGVAVTLLVVGALAWKGKEVAKSAPVVVGA